MRGNLLKKLCAVMLLLSVITITPAISPAAPAPKPAAAAPTAPQREDEGRGGRERHPHIRAAIRELQAAKHELQVADHDFGGHRDEAVEACDKALHQLQQALQFDKK